jgi:hypothetical protein
MDLLVLAPSTRGCAFDKEDSAMHARRVPFPLYLALALVAVAFFIVPAASVRAEEPEILKGTIKTLEPGVLSLTDVSFSDPTVPRKDIRMSLDNATAYYYGATKVPREELTVGCRVLVKCVQTSSGRKATMVRIIGGKAQ